MRLLNPPTDAFSRVRHGDLLDQAIERKQRPKQARAIRIICGKCEYVSHSVLAANYHAVKEHGDVRDHSGFAVRG